jgi:hypothetical protein
MIVGGKAIVGGTRSCLQLDGSSWLNGSSGFDDGSAWLNDGSLWLDGSSWLDDGRSWLDLNGSRWLDGRCESRAWLGSLLGAVFRLMGALGLMEAVFSLMGAVGLMGEEGQYWW